MAKLTPLKMVNSASPVVTCLPSSEAVMMVGTRLFSIFSSSVVLWVAATALSAATASAATILAYGDSLSAAHGLPQEQGWVSLLARRLAAEKFDYKVANASITGETTQGGRNRIEAALKTHRPSIVILELGANDGLRGT